MQRMRPKHEVAAAFDSKAQAYARHRQRQHGYLVQRRVVLQMVHGGGGRALELGCGSGGIAQDLVAKGYRVVGVDLSLKMLTAARQAARQVPHLEFVRADAEALCFPDAAFDLVVAMGMLEYLEHFESAIREVRRVLRPGGEALFTVPTSVSPSALLDGLIAAMPTRVRKSMLRRNSLPQGDPVHRVRPWQLDRALSAGYLLPQERSFCQFTLSALESIAPRCSAAIAHAFEPLGRYQIAGLLGRQYVVRTVRV